MAKCPVCKNEDNELYQVSYPGQKEYVPPRCEACYQKMIERRKKHGSHTT